MRRLEGSEEIWEIAHDFLARTIGPLIGRLKPTLMQRIRPLVAPIILLGWIIVFAAALLFWKLSHQREVEKILTESFGAKLQAALPKGLMVDLYDEIRQKDVDDQRLADIVPVLEQLDELAMLDIKGDELTSLEPLKKLTNLSQLRVHDSGLITSSSLESLKGLTNCGCLISRMTISSPAWSPSRDSPS